MKIVPKYMRCTEKEGFLQLVKFGKGCVLCSLFEIYKVNSQRGLLVNKDI